MIFKKMKQFLILFLCAVIIVTNMPMDAFATELKSEQETVLEQSGESEDQIETEPEDQTEIEAEDQTDAELVNQSEVEPISEIEVISEPVSGAEDAGSFVLAVFSQNVAVIEPVKVNYETGDTVKDALVKSGYTFTGIETGFIQSVEGTNGNYSIAFANGGFALDTPADKVVTMFISERTDVNVESNSELVEAVSAALKEMETYKSATNNVQNFGKAADAYKTSLVNMRTGSAATIAENTTALVAAVKEYTDFLTSGKRKVTVNVTQGGVEVNDAKIEFIDQYGNVTTAIGNEIEVLDGKYTVVVTDTHHPYNYSTNVGRMNATSGGNWYDVNNYFTVSETSTELSVKLASGEWYGPIRAEANASTALNEDLSEIDYGYHKAVFYLADNFAGNVKPTINKGDGTPDKDTAGTLSSRNIVPWVDFIYATGDNAGKWISSVATSASTCSMSYGSARSCLNFVAKGMTGNTFYTDIRWLDDTAEDATNFIVMQSFEMEVKRFPTFTEIDVKDNEGSSLISAFDPFTYSYDVTTIADSFTVDATPFAENYNVSFKAGENTVVESNSIKLNGESGSFSVVVETQGVSTEYKVNLTKVSAADVTLSMEEGVTAQVFNVSGSLIAPKEANGNVYSLVPDETYTYVSTKEVNYHATATFKATAGQTVTVATPEVKTVVTNFAVYDASNKNTRVAYKWDKAFEVGTYNYTWYVPDAKSGNVLYAQSTRAVTTYDHYIRHKKQSTSASQADTIQDWTIKNITYAVDTTKSGTALGSYIVQVSGQSNELKMQMRRTASDVTYYQEFIFDIVRVLTLKDLSVSTESAGVIGFTDASGEALKFDRDILEYTVKVGSDVQELTLSGIFQNTDSDFSFDGGYYATVNGTRYDDISNVVIDLDSNKDTETIEIEVGHRDRKAVKQTYKVNVIKQKPVKVIFETTPSNALVFVVNQLDNKVVYSDSNGVFTMMPDVPYTYTVSAADYKIVQVTDFKLTELAEGEADTKTIEVTLEKAPQPPVALPDYDAQWPTFRADNNGNGVVSSKTPIKDEETVLYWATKVGEGFDTGATGCPILVDGYLFTYAGNAIVKVDTMSGEVVASGEMCTSSSFAINSPTYAEGMIFVGLSGGRVQAFNADTLESLWIYSDPKGGQPNCSIKYYDGHIYTGFWNAENKPANFVCIPVADEDPTKPDEVKLASWRYTHNGFYWAGAYVNDKFVFVGTDDGEQGYGTGHASVLSFDRATGKLIDEIVLPYVGDLRSDIMYDEKGTGNYYFTTKGGYIYRLQTNEDGTFKNLMSLKLYNYANSDSNPPMSTSTPVIYNGRAYIGVSGIGQFSAYSGHNITVVDLASWSIAYTVRTQGYPQTSGLLTTAYEDETGYAYIYFIDNYTPGKLRILADKPGRKAPIETTAESGYETAKVLFTPTGAQGQYAICSPIADENGVIYFKNDSAYMMALGPVIDEIKVTTMPAKTEYGIGETFDKTGMVVKAYYANGTEKDITKYVTFSAEPLTKDDTEFTITFPYVMYQNKDGQTGVDYPEPMVSIPLEVTMNASTVVMMIEAIGTVTLDSETAINEALEAYNALSDAEKAKVTNLDTLTAAQEALSQCKADKVAAETVSAQILAIAEAPNLITLDKEADVEAAKAAFYALSTGAKSYFNANCASARGFLNMAIQIINSKKSGITAAENAINAIGTPITIESEAAIQDARAKYDKLADDQKARISEETLKILTDAEAVLEQLKADNVVYAVVEKINAIGTVTLESETAINEALEAYNALSDAEKAKVTNLDILTAAQEALSQCKADKVAAEKVSAQILAIAETPNLITLDKEADVEAAKAAFNALSTGAKSYFTANCATAKGFLNMAIQIINSKKSGITAAEEAINAIGTSITIESETAITTARAKYDKLADDQKARISEETLKILTDAEAALEQLKADKEVVDAVVKKINAIGTVTLESETAINEARTAYDALTDGQKAQISADTLAVLTDAEAAFAQLNAYEEAALALEAQVKAIAPQPGLVKLSQKAEVEAAKAVYMAFSDGAKEYFNTNCKTAYNLMTGFFNVLIQKEAKLDAAVKAINAIGTQITLESEKAITTARTTYDKLPTDVQEEVSAETLKILTDAETIFAQLKLHDLEKIESSAPTCIKEGNLEHYKCSKCGTLYNDDKCSNQLESEDVIIAKLKHDMTKTEASDATCTEPGNVEYYTCSVCEKVYADEDGETEMKDVVIPAAHDLKKEDEVKATCTEDGQVSHYHCAACQKNFADAAGTQELTSVTIPADHGGMRRTAYKAATCTKAGNVEYYTCSVCKKHFEDRKGENLITNVVIPASHGTMTHTAAKAATCAEAGNVEYDTCSVCQKNFEDATAAKELTNVVIKALGHQMTKKASTAASCTGKGNVEYYHCDTCQKNFADKAGTKEMIDVETSAVGHKLCEVKAKAPTCTTAGNVTYYHCDACNKNFGDLQCTTELTNVVVIATGHSMGVKTEKVEPTCTTDGKVAYYTCGNCSGYFADAEGKQALDTIVIPRAHKIAAVQGKEPKVGEEGIAPHYECSSCHDKFADEKGTKPVDVDKVKLPALVPVKSEPIKEVPEDLAVDFRDAAEIKDEIERRVEEIVDVSADTKIETVHFEFNLQSENDMPDDEMITIRWKYKDIGSGSGKDKDFIVTHMYKDANGDVTVEFPEVFKDDEGIWFVVKGLSPISVSWVEKVKVDNPTPPSGGSGKDDSSDSDKSNTSNVTEVIAPAPVEIAKAEEQKAPAAEVKKEKAEEVIEEQMTTDEEPEVTLEEDLDKEDAEEEKGAIEETVEETEEFSFPMIPIIVVAIGGIAAAGAFIFKKKFED